MTNVVRLVNGGTVQVRTGVIQGIGPQGPRGVAGPAGNDGPTGPQGEQGPVGSVTPLAGKTVIAGTNTINANTDTLITFGSVTYDELSCFTSSTNVTLTAAGDYMLSAWLGFAAGTATKREIWFMSGATLVARHSEMADTGAWYINLAFPFRAAGGEVITVYARSAGATTIAAGSGALAVTRVGTGPAGPQGPTGPQGAQGATGPQGPTGPPGSSSSGFATYSLILPH